MSPFWSVFITLITLGLIAACALLLYWNQKNYTGVKEGDDMNHFFDGIVELNNPLPKWWTYLFYICIVFGLVYLLLFPGLGNYKGLLNWTSSNQGILNLAESKAAVEQAKTEGRIVEYDREIARAEQVYGSIFDAYAARPITELATDPEALKVGQRLYLQNCAQCHGSDARGQTGFPNLTDNDWLFGGSPEAIKHSLIYGRKAAMPGWLDVMGEQGVAEVAEYMLSLSGRQVDATLAKAGEARYAVCVACHGADGKGNQMIGAPNLTDSIWLYGGNKQAVIETLYYGRNGVMPAFKDTLGEQKVHLVSAYIYSLSQ